MKLGPRFFRRSSLRYGMRGVLGCFLGVGALPLGAAEEAPALKSPAWIGVGSIRGEATVTIVGRNEEKTPAGSSNGASEQTTTITFVLERTTGGSGQVHWRSVEAHATYRMRTRSRSEDHFGYTRSWSEALYRGGLRDEITADYDAERGVFSFAGPNTAAKAYEITGNAEMMNWSGGEGFTSQPTREMSDALDGGTLIDESLPEQVRTVTFDRVLDESDPRRGATVTKRTHVLLIPVPDDLEVEVTIDGYEKWRPKGSIEDPGKPGNGLVARAVLKSKSGKIKELPEVERFRFELLDTSREPGVCLNWPLDAKDKDYDLRFADFSTGTSAAQLAAMRQFGIDWGMASMGTFDPASMPAGGMPSWSFGEVSENGQKAEVTAPARDKAGQPAADAAIECFDFGARAELRVTCFLKDGREITGLMKGERGSLDIVRLPKMDGPGWIADSWRKANDVLNLADNDDNEEVKGQKHNGDGYTLYEEYRGFVENGRHISGDPKRKDLFVMNLADVSTRSGIALFERLSQVKVHARLKDDKEMARKERLMNGNHRDGPHRVDQHGVILTHVPNLRAGGGDTIGVEDADDAKSYRPRLVSRIYVEEPDAPNGLFSAREMKYYHIDHLNKRRLYAAAVAHELLHSVGVDHHGEYRMSSRWGYFQGPSDPMNPTHKMRFTEYWGKPSWYFINDPKRTWADADRGATMTLFWEDTKQNLIEERAAAFSAALAKERVSYASDAYVGDSLRQLARLGKSDEYMREYLAHQSAEHDFDFLMFVGEYQGTDCGDESCVMRYYFATAYEAKGTKNTYYVMRPGVKQAAIGICKSTAGTGGNAPSHDPQSRFGPAHPGRGNCFEEICPNDDIPPRSIVLN